MKAGDTPAAGLSAPALQLQNEIRRLVGTSLPLLVDGGALLARCRDLQARNPRDVRMLWLAARIITADSILGKQLAKVLAPPRRKAKTKRRQRVEAKIAELNSHFANFDTGDGPKDGQ
jgi:hypothetical protein